ncbi:MAG: hypothetical protein RSA12_10745, partial [Clostridia bacterium]
MTKFLRLIACVLLVALVGGLTPMMALAEPVPVPPTPMRVLGMGNKGEDVVRLQNRLVALEYTRAVATGKFNRS